MDVGAPGQIGRIDLHHRADHDKLPIRARPRRLEQEVDVEPLVEHPEEPGARMRDRRLVVRIADLRSGAAEMLDVHRARKQMHMLVPVHPGFEQAEAAGEHHVGLGEHALLLLTQIGGRETERGQLVHAVEHGQLARDAGGDRAQQRRVEPEHRPADAAIREEFPQQPRLDLPSGHPARALRQQRAQHRDALGARDRVEPGLRRRTHARLLPKRDRLFPEEHRQPGGDEARHQMLRPLEDKIPAQMGEANQRIHLRQNAEVASRIIGDNAQCHRRVNHSNPRLF